MPIETGFRDALGGRRRRGRRVVPRDLPVRFRRRSQAAGLGAPLPPAKQLVPSRWCTGTAFVGIAANEELDVAEAERCFREALRVAKRSGDTHSHAARLACGLLGELLYERGDVDEADRLLDESYQLGAEGGVVEIMICPLRHRCAHQGACAATAMPPRDAWTTVHGSRQLLAFRGCAPTSRTSGCGWSCRSPHRRDGSSTRTRVPDGGLGEITAQLRDETEIRGLLADQPGLACDRAHAWVHRLQPQARPRALLQANRLLVAALSAAGRTDDAKQTLAQHRRTMRRARNDPLPARRRATGCRAAGGASRRPAQRSLEADMAGDPAGLPRHHGGRGPEHQLRRRRSTCRTNLAATKRVNGVSTDLPHGSATVVA